MTAHDATSLTTGVLKKTEGLASTHGSIPHLLEIDQVSHWSCGSEPEQDMQMGQIVSIKLETCLDKRNV